MRRRRLEEPEDSSDELEGELLGLYELSDFSESLDSLEDEGSGPYGEALKSFMCVSPTFFRCNILTVYFDTGRP